MKKYVILFIVFLIIHPFWTHGFYFYIFGICRDKFLFDFIEGAFLGGILCFFFRLIELRRQKN